MIAGHDPAIAQFLGARASLAMHHAWLLTGPRGVGKAHFARSAALRLLADAAGPPVDGEGLDTPPDHRIARLLEAGSHPDLRLLERLPRERSEELARNITVTQVRSLGEFLTLTPALSDWRAVVIDAVDDLEASGANALLKMLEEPPPNTVFFLVSHVPGRLLPTIRSRCRRLDLRKLDEAAMTSVVEQHLPQASAAERARLIAHAGGSPGLALAMADLDLASLEQKALEILRQGDPYNERRTALADELAKKSAAPRYRAFLDLLPSLIVREARTAAPPQRERALAAYDKARELSSIAPRLSLDPAATIFQLGGILASAAPGRLP